MNTQSSYQICVPFIIACAYFALPSQNDISLFTISYNLFECMSVLQMEEEEEEEVKLISSIFDRAQGIHPGMEDDEILPEFEDLLSGEIEYPLPGDKFNNTEKDKVYESEMANNASELERLRNLVKELEEREVKLEGELLEYYGLKEQEYDVTELQRQLKIKTVEIDMLNITINSLQAERKKLQEEIAKGPFTKKELEVARNKIKELQRQIQLDANQTKGQLLLLKKQVSGLQAKEEEAIKKDAEVEKKLKAVKELEVEVVELKRKNRELQHEKRELIVKLDAAEAKVLSLSNMTEVRAAVLANICYVHFRFLFSFSSLIFSGPPLVNICSYIFFSHSSAE